MRTCVVSSPTGTGESRNRKVAAASPKRLRARQTKRRGRGRMMETGGTIQSPPMPPPTIAVDLRALVPTPTGIGVYTRSLLLELAARGGMRYRGLAHRPPRCAEELAA